VIVLVAFGAVLHVVLALLGMRDLTSVLSTRARLIAAVAGTSGAGDLPLIERCDRLLRSTRFGRNLERELQLAGLDRRPVVVLGAGASIAAVSTYLLWTLLAPVLGVVGLVIGAYSVRWYLRRGRERRKEQFIGQLPELARVLANTTNAGLSLATSLAIAGDELDEPARSELKRVSTSVMFGSDLASALDELRERVGSREVSVLVSTLVVASRSGGSLVSSLRDIADTLDARKETRREIRTTLSQSLATGNLIIILGFGMLFLLNVIQPGTVQIMTRNIVGQIALVVSSGLFVGGFLMIRRMTRVEP
jgi:tight adherence protein B